MYHKQENRLDTCFLRLMFLLRDLFLSLLQSHNVQRVSLGWIVVGSSLIQKKVKLAKMTTRCHSLSFVVTRCLTRCHSVYNSLSFVVTRCHSMYRSSVFLNDRP